MPSFLAKLCPRSELDHRIAALARPIVFTNGVFDILHRGHVSYLAQARELGASLVIGSTATCRRGCSAKGRTARSTPKQTAPAFSPRSKA
jgi:cytidyltransferase-like protein